VQTLLKKLLAQGLFVQRPLFIRVIHNLHMQFKMILTLIGLASVLAAPMAGAQSPTDDVLLQMQQAYRRGDTTRLTSLLPQAQGSLLEPWAAYWALSARLETATPTEISAFLRRYAGTYQEDRLRNDWLLLLGRRRDWTQYAWVAQDFRMNDDREVRCYTLTMENILAKVNMADEVKSLWYAEKNAGDGCTLAAQSHFSAGQLTEADIWFKARLTVEARQLDATRQVVAIAAPDASAQLTEALKKPEQFLLKRPPSSQRPSQELAVLALIRWADSNPDDAAQALDERWSQKLSSAQRGWAWGAIGKQAAQKLSDNALGYFQKASPTTMTDDQLAWRARAALRQSQWTDALNAIQAMSPDAASDSTWVYWRARALMQPGRDESDRAQARQLLQDIAGVRGFYPLLAEEELGQPITPPTAPSPLTPEEKQRAQANPGLQRALAAIDLGLRSEGVREWNYSTNMHVPGGMNDRELLAAADLACQHAVWDRCINTSERTRSVIDMTQRFPMPYRQAVVQRSSEIGLDPAYVYGLIRQESRFVTDARSGVGASGLMQLMPATARWTAKKIGLTDFKAHQLSDRDTNIALGTGYLKLVLDDFAGSMPMAAAAYNAGPGRPRSWRGSAGSPVLEAAIWAENIPFNETRDYVKKVLANTTLYAAMITGQTQSLKARLGRIGPRDAAVPDNSELP
jgi:soluble lytic murein transglycosylase